MSHNTVVVNGRESELDTNHTGNRLRTYTTDGNLFHVASAASSAAYSGIASQYQRTLALIGDSASDGYLIDVFDVRGGKQHDYLLHGSRDEDSTATVAGTKLQPFAGTLLNPGARFTRPTHERESAGGPEGSYGFVHSLERGTSSGGQTVLSFLVKNSPQTGSRSTLFTAAGDAVFLGQAPSIRRAGGAHLKEDESLLDRFQAPLLCWRRQGNDLQSRFLAIHESLPVAIPVRSVEQKELGGKALLIRIDRGEAGVDYFIKAYAANAEVRTTTVNGSLTFQGDYGFIRTAGGQVREARLVGQGYLTLGDHRLENKTGCYQGKVVMAAHSDHATSGGYFDVSEVVPANWQYSALQITFPDGTERAYNILKVEPLRSAQGSRIYVREKSGFHTMKDHIKIVSYPQRIIKGTDILYKVSTLTGQPLWSRP